MIHLYALSRSPLQRGLHGIHAARLTAIEVDELYAVVSHHAAALPGSADTALEHVATIEALAEHGDVVPVRFGRGHADGPALQAKLEEALPELRVLLDRVGGHVEFVVRSVAPPSPATSDAGVDGNPQSSVGTGRAYLEGRRALAHAAAEQRKRFRDRLHEVTRPLIPHATDAQVATGRNGPERCFLVSKDSVQKFGICARELTAEANSIVVGGPWPPFTFATLPSDVGIEP